MCVWDSLGETRSSLSERRLESTVLKTALLPIKTVQFTHFIRQVCHTVKSLSLTEELDDKPIQHGLLTQLT